MLKKNRAGGRSENLQGERASSNVLLDRNRVYIKIWGVRGQPPAPLPLYPSDSDGPEKYMRCVNASLADVSYVVLMDYHPAVWHYLRKNYVLGIQV